MKTITWIAAVVCWGVGWCAGQPPAEPAAEVAEVAASNRAYEAAYAKGDADALIEFFTADAEFTDDEGLLHSGRTEIGEAIRNGLRANRGARLKIEPLSVHLLAPKILLENGLTTLTAEDGEKTSARYNAVFVHHDGRWRIRQLTEAQLPLETPRDRLAGLGWLVGEWRENDPENDLEVESQVRWARGGNFLTRSVTVRRAGEVTLEGWQIIGWDPLEQRIRSWTFDTQGGHAEGKWTQEGQRWLVRENGVAPDGSRTGADNVMAKLSPSRMSWESMNRTVNGEPRPNVPRIEAQRVNQGEGK
ncbi:MAG: Ketosteroid isomerase-like protein [Verrucomicrobia bacterium]|nr:MAG: Ketosteroid isomerase-like protein [Verrucomicrobiota bacterium]